MFLFLNLLFKTTFLLLHTNQDTSFLKSKITHISELDEGQSHLEIFTPVISVVTLGHNLAIILVKYTWAIVKAMKSQMCCQGRGDSCGVG